MTGKNLTKKFPIKATLNSKKFKQKAKKNYEQ